MKDRIGRFPYNRVQFTKHGEIFLQAEVESLIKRIRDEEWNEVVFISHGWNNNVEEAEALYEKLFGNVERLLQDRSYSGMDQREIGVVGIFWPSKRFTQAELRPGGGASVGEGIDRPLEVEIDAIVEYSARKDAVQLGEKAKSLLRTLDQNVGDQNDFVATIRALLNDGTGESGLTEDFAEPDDLSGSELLEVLGDAELEEAEEEFPGGAAGLEDFFDGIKKGAARFLNLTTYFKMKRRAGTVGSIGGAEVVRRVAEAYPVARVHLVGHSFGARLVSAIAKAHAAAGLSLVESATLLQGAFSHFGFAKNFDGERDGFFRTALEAASVKRTIAVTYSIRDQANATAYPLASRLHREDAAAVGGHAGLGDASDRFGAIGRNGALKTPEAVFDTMLNADGDYVLPANRIVNFNGEDHIACHGDVCNRAVANLLLHVMVG